MNKKVKALLLVLCALILVVGSVMGTFAYLTDTKQVQNTFTVGNVIITLDEAKVDDDGKKLNPEDRHANGNEYHLLPGHTYDKDPIIHVDANSEDCYLFIKVENGISNIEDDVLTINVQLTDNGNWTLVPGEANIYYYKDVCSGGLDISTFTKFKIDEAVDGATLANYTDAKVVVTAYAIQEDGFAGEPIEDIWDALDTQLNPQP